MAKITGMHTSGSPAGTILPCAGASALPGTLLCQGQAVSRVTYAALFAVIGTTHGAGDGSTLLRLAEGVTPRVWRLAWSRYVYADR